jgi:Antitoxin VbhA
MSVLRPQPIAEQEKEARAWRERFVQNAAANVLLEGLEPSPKALEICQSYIEGEVSVEQAGELIRALPTGVQFARSVPTRTFIRVRQSSKIFLGSVIRKY